MIVAVVNKTLTCRILKIHQTGCVSRGKTSAFPMSVAKPHPL